MPASARTIRKQNVASIESAREAAMQAAAATSQAAQAAQATIWTTIELPAPDNMNSGDQFTGSIGCCEEDVNAECGAVRLRAFQEISREWLSTFQDVVSLQTDLICDMLENSRLLGEASAKVAGEVARTLTASHDEPCWQMSDLPKRPRDLPA